MSLETMFSTQKLLHVDINSSKVHLFGIATFFLVEYYFTLDIFFDESLLNFVLTQL
jgi:hypothetical protein